MHDFLSNLESSLSRLAHIPRTGWLIRGVEQPESVADHIFGTLMLSMLAEDIDRRQRAELARPLTMALIHDAAEIYTGDLTPRTKQYTSSESEWQSYEHFEASHFDKFLALLPQKSRTALSEIWNEHAQSRTPRAKRVHVADIVEMLSQAYEYEKTGQRKLDEFWEWVPKCSDDEYLFELAQAIQRRRNFLKASSMFRYEQIQAAHYHRTRDFALKQEEQDSKGWTKRDGLVGHSFRRNVALDDRKQCQILDVGCGLGSFSRWFLETTPAQVEVFGIDINFYLLSRAEEIWRGKPFHALEPLDIGWYWDVDSDAYDVVLLGEVLEHVFDPWFLLMESFRVLRTGGLLLVSVPNSFHREKLQRMTDEKKVELRWREEHIRYFGAVNLVGLLQETGFHVHDLWGLKKGWHDLFDLEVRTDKEDPRAIDAWTLMACATKKGSDAIRVVGVTKPPGRLGEDVPLEHRVIEHREQEERSKVHKFVEEMNKAKLLRVDNADARSETIAQQTFRNAVLACCIAIESDFDAEHTIRHVLLQGFVEAHLAEFSPAIRAAHTKRTRTKALEEVLRPLPDAAASKYQETYKSSRDSAEGLIAEYFRLRDFAKLGIDIQDREYILTQLRQMLPAEALVYLDT